MRKPGYLVVGIVMTLAGILFSLQGYNVLTGSAMSNSTFWRVGGPVVILAGLAVIRIGQRGRLR